MFVYQSHVVPPLFLIFLKYEILSQLLVDHVSACSGYVWLQLAITVA